MKPIRLRHIHILLVVVILALTLTAVSAQQGRAITTLSDDLDLSTVLLRIPDSGTVNVSGFTVVPGEPAPSCSSAPGSKSGWFFVNHPGGTLVIDTDGSTFITQVQLFAADTILMSDLVELGCDTGSLSADARLEMTDLPSRDYIVRISCADVCAAFSLSLELSYTPPAGAVPPNNDIAGAAPITASSAVKTFGIEHADNETDENTLLGCTMYNTVWYAFTAPYIGYYSLNTFGSQLNRGPAVNVDTKIALYTSTGGLNFADLNEIACNDNFTSAYSMALLFFNQGQQTYVRVGTNDEANLLAGSFYRLKASVVSIYSMLENRDFEAGLAPWTLATTADGDGVTNTFYLVGAHSVVMHGAPDKTNKLKQKWTPADHSLKLAKRSTILAYGSYSTNGTVADNAKAILKIKYTGGTPASKASADLLRSTPANEWSYFTVVAEVAKSKIANVSLIIKNKSSGGTLYIDDASINIFGDPARERGAKSDAPLPVLSESRSTTPGGLLPPPAAPDGFRGGS